jgi:hypothetical protein
VLNAPVPSAPPVRDLLPDQSPLAVQLVGELDVVQLRLVEPLSERFAASGVRVTTGADGVATHADPFHVGIVAPQTPTVTDDTVLSPPALEH